MVFTHLDSRAESAIKTKFKKSTTRSQLHESF